MDQRRINMTDLVAGEPLPWDVYDDANRLLLRKGYIVEHSKQIEALVERGLFIDAKALQREPDAAPAKPRQETPSVLRLINAANRRLERLLFNLESEADAQAKIIELAKTIMVATDINSDIALACIHLNQETSPYAVRHCVDTAVVALVLARAMKKTPDEILAIMAAALTMNVAMLQHQQQLQESKAALSEKERELIESHPQEGCNILKRAGVDSQDWLSQVLLHHENEDGSGYPFGKKAPEIPQNAKIVALADRYCASVSARNYRKQLLPNAALRDLLLVDKKTIDPELATCLIRELGAYPTGSFVRLINGEIGVVTHKGQTSTTPVVHALIGPRGAPLAFPIRRDTERKLFTIQQVLSDGQAAIHCTMKQLWGDEASL